MADNTAEDSIEDMPSTLGGDIEMAEGEGEGVEGGANANGNELPFAIEGLEEQSAPRVSFVQLLSTPIVTLLLGSGESETTLTAHQGLLVQSPFFVDACAEFTDDGSVCPPFVFKALLVRSGIACSLFPHLLRLQAPLIA